MAVVMARDWTTLGPGRVQVGNMSWTHSGAFDIDDPDEDSDAGSPGECATCEQTVQAAAAHWYCDDNGEVVHEECEIPGWR